MRLGFSGPGADWGPMPAAAAGFLATASVTKICFFCGLEAAAAFAARPISCAFLLTEIVPSALRGLGAACSDMLESAAYTPHERRLSVVRTTWRVGAFALTLWGEEGRIPTVHHVPT